MEAKQTIAVFGASGSTGSAITKSIAKGPYRLLLMSNDVGKTSKASVRYFKGKRKKSKNLKQRTVACARHRKLSRKNIHSS